MAVYVNQVGYQTKQKKHATVSETTVVELYKKGEGQDTLVLTQDVKDLLQMDDRCEEAVAKVDFSSVTEAGQYYFKDAEGNISAVFPISDDCYDQVFLDSMRMFYFQRCGMELEEKYAGPYAHKACHTDPVSLLWDPSKKFSCCGGWHDAGDYGRYVTAAAVALGHLLYAYELCPKAFDLDMNIPESGNGVPDILNECRYELEWMLLMQTEDGSVYHKCTSRKHTDFVMPEDDPLDFIVTPISSLATADFAAVMALSARIYAQFDVDFAEKMKAAAIRAWGWLKGNKLFVFTNPAEECHTGFYDDFCDADERLWAATEMARLIGEDDCFGSINQILELKLATTALGWVDVAGFASIAVLTAPAGVFDNYLINKLKSAWKDEADRLVKVTEENAFELVLHAFDYKWGSNMVILTDAMVLCFAHKLFGDVRYLDAAWYQMDYILGRNAMDTSYVTGHGERAFNEPHNRPTVVDGIDAAIPGYVSGGPNRVPCDPHAIEHIPEGAAPMKCYVDAWESYSTNEITIYWNSPLVYCLAYLLHC